MKMEKVVPVYFSMCPNCGRKRECFFDSSANSQMCICGCIFLYVVKIKIIKIPRGSAPKKIRKEWLGLTFFSERPIFKKVGSQIKLFGGEFVGVIFKKIYRISAEDALRTLKKNSPKIIRWLVESWDPIPDFFDFGINEVEKVEEFYIYIEPENSEIEIIIDTIVH